MRRLAAIAILALSCAPRGSIVTISSPGSSPMRYSVGRLEISGPDFRASLKGNCVSGYIAREAIELCQDKPGHWAGTSGEMTLTPLPSGKDWKVEGRIDLGNLSAGGWYDVTQTLRAQEGESWAELRAHPILYLLAEIATDLHPARRRP